MGIGVEESPEVPVGQRHLRHIRIRTPRLLESDNLLVEAALGRVPVRGTCAGGDQTPSSSKLQSTETIAIL